MSKNVNRNRRKGESYIDIRIRGRFKVIAKDREEAAELVRNRIYDEILTAHPSFETTGLPSVWAEWLDEQTSLMLGIEVRETDGEIIEDLEVTWTNIKGGKLNKGGRIRL